MKNLFFVIVPLFSCICGCSTNTGKTDLLASPGLEVQSEHFPGSTFMPYSKMIVPAESGWLVKNPSEKTAVFAVLKGITLDPNGIYELRMRVMSGGRRPDCSSMVLNIKMAVFSKKISC